jgi:hypothetical protein
VSDHTGRPEIYRVGLSEQRASRVTSELTGISGITALSPALSIARNTGQAAFSVFRDGGYEVHLLDTTAQQTEAVSDTPVVNLAALPPATRETSQVQQALARATDGLPAPQTFESQPYRPKLSLLAVGQQLGASTGGVYGTYVSAGIGLLFSDLLGEHLLSTGVGVEGGVKDISAQVSYINRTRRWNWGVFGEHVPLLSGTVQAATGIINGQQVYVEQTELLRQTYTQGGAMIALPMSRAFRVEATAAARRIGFDRELETRVFDAFSGAFLFEEKEDLDTLDGINLFDVTAALVRDTSAFGAVGPIAGQRFRLEAGPTFGDLQMTNVTADFRQYAQPFGAVTFAARGLHAGRYGVSGEDQRLMPLFLGYSTLVRGYDVNSFEADECSITADGSCPEFDRLVGSRILVFNGEVRAPLVGLFTGNLDYGPIPTELFGFYDGGVAWSNDTRPSFANGTRDWIASAGFGLRANALGYAIVELNMARPLNRPGRGWMFVFNLRPSF